MAFAWRFLQKDQNVRCRYRFDGKAKMVSLGVWPEVRLPEAREKRDEVRKALRQGIDPAVYLKSQQSITEGQDSFEAVARDWFEKFRHKWADNTADRKMSRLESHICTRIKLAAYDENRKPLFCRVNCLNVESAPHWWGHIWSEDPLLFDRKGVYGAWFCRHHTLNDCAIYKNAWYVELIVIKREKCKIALLFFLRKTSVYGVEMDKKKGLMAVIEAFRGESRRGMSGKFSDGYSSSYKLVVGNR